MCALVHVVTIHFDTFGDQLIHIRRQHVTRWIFVIDAMPPSIGPAVIVEQDHRDVWLLASGRRDVLLSAKPPAV